MAVQLSQDYNVDSRYAAGKSAVDNEEGKRFLERYIEQRRELSKPVADQQPEDKFILSGPGDTLYGFRNAFRASK